MEKKYKVKELVEHFRISIQYSKDIDLINKYEDREVIAYYYAGSKGLVNKVNWRTPWETHPNTTLFMFYSARKLMCFLNGERIEPHDAIQLFKNFKTEKQEMPEGLEDELRTKLVMSSV